MDRNPLMAAPVPTPAWAKACSIIVLRGEAKSDDNGVYGLQAQMMALYTTLTGDVTRRNISRLTQSRVPVVKELAKLLTSRARGETLMNLYTQTRKECGEAKGVSRAPHSRRRASGSGRAVRLRSRAVQLVPSRAAPAGVCLCGLALSSDEIRASRSPVARHGPACAQSCRSRRGLRADLAGAPAAGDASAVAVAAAMTVDVAHVAATANGVLAAVVTPPDVDMQLPAVANETLSRAEPAETSSRRRPLGDMADDGQRRKVSQMWYPATIRGPDAAPRRQVTRAAGDAAVGGAAAAAPPSVLLAANGRVGVAAASCGSWLTACCSSARSSRLRVCRAETRSWRRQRRCVSATPPPARTRVRAHSR